MAAAIAVAIGFAIGDLFIRLLKWLVKKATNSTADNNLPEGSNPTVQIYSFVGEMIWDQKNEKIWKIDVTSEIEMSTNEALQVLGFNVRYYVDREDQNNFENIKGYKKFYNPLPEVGNYNYVDPYKPSKLCIKGSFDLRAMPNPGEKGNPYDTILFNGVVIRKMEVQAIYRKWFSIWDGPVQPEKMHTSWQPLYVYDRNIHSGY